MFFHRAPLLSERSTSLPSLIFRVSFRMFLTKNPTPATKTMAKIKLGMYCILGFQLIIDRLGLFLVQKSSVFDCYKFIA